MKKTVVTLGHREYTVYESRRPFKRDKGYIDVPNKRIVISRGQTPDEQRRTFIHEALHALFWFLDEDVVYAAAEELCDAEEQLDF